ncbi:hypothetical protein H4F44_25245, partial [Escherichia coli]|nr:hypothetical protein [Escherichia coli]
GADEDRPSVLLVDDDEVNLLLTSTALRERGFSITEASSGPQALRLLAGSPRIEALPIDYTAVAVDLMRQREVWLRDGDLWDAVRASIVIPGVFTPYTLRGREL